MSFFLKHLRGFRRTWVVLPTRSKLIYGSLVFNSALACGVAVHSWQLHRRSRQLWEEHLRKVDSETDGWRCYSVARLFREQCRHAAPATTHDADGPSAPSNSSSDELTSRIEEGDGDAFCGRVWQAMVQCSEQLYATVADRDLPAMRPSVALVNRPHWLKEPEWLVGAKPTKNDGSDS